MNKEQTCGFLDSVHLHVIIMPTVALYCSLLDMGIINVFYSQTLIVYNINIKSK